MSGQSGLAVPVSMRGSVSVALAPPRFCLGTRLWKGARPSGRAPTPPSTASPHPTHIWGPLCTGTEPRERPQAPPQTSADSQQHKPLPKPIFQRFFPVWELQFYIGTHTWQTPSRVFVQLRQQQINTTFSTLIFML